jgi:hypothetical protein
VRRALEVIAATTKAADEYLRRNDVHGRVTASPPRARDEGIVLMASVLGYSVW